MREVLRVQTRAHFLDTYLESRDGSALYQLPHMTVRYEDLVARPSALQVSTAAAHWLNNR